MSHLEHVQQGLGADALDAQAVLVHAHNLHEEARGVGVSRGACNKGQAQHAGHELDHERSRFHQLTLEAYQEPNQQQPVFTAHLDHELVHLSQTPPTNQPTNHSHYQQEHPP